MTLTPATLRLDKKCGASGIAKNKKCTKGSTAPTATPPEGAPPRKSQNRGPDVINTLRSAYATFGLGAATAEFADYYQKSGNIAYAGAGVGAAVGTLLSAAGTREFARGNSGKGLAYNLGAAGTFIGSALGAQAYANHQEAQRKRRAQTGYTGSNPFKDLGVKEGSSAEELRRAYIKKAQAAHPDRGGSAKAMAKVNAAYQEALLRVGGKPKRAARSKAPSPRGRFLSPSRGDSLWAWGF